MRRITSLAIFVALGILYTPSSQAGILDDLNSAVRSYLGDREHNQYNVLFYKEDGKEVYLGKVKGISNCQRMASSYARQHNMRLDWICCLTSGGSFCKEKHR